VDVEAAAKAFGVQPEAFLNELVSRQAVPFAIKPLTLRFLLEKFRQNGRLPDQIVEIYLEGCRSLCAETNPSRLETGRAGKLSADQRLAVAERLAALTLFAGRTAISQEVSLAGQLDEGVLSIQETLGGSEKENESAVEITPEAVRETLDTGLFSARGAVRLGWAHQTYAEFLAARYLIRHGFDTAQKISLVTHPDYSSRLVIPQLVQTTVCLVNLDPALFEELVRDSPHVLLRSEASAWDDRQKFALTASFLKLIADLKLTDRDNELRRGLSKLDHPNLASQLETYIRDRTANAVVRRVAIGIAEACHVIQLRETLLELALDRSDHQPTRVQAIRALRETGDNTIRQQLATLLSTDLLEDDDDQIRGAVLNLAWPDLLSFENLTQYLTEPKDSSFIGAYWIFLKDELAQRLRLTDLPQALVWAGQQEGWRGILSPLAAAADNIVKAGCRYVDDLTILSPLTIVIEERLKNQRSLWNEDRFDESTDGPLQDVSKRHFLIQSLVDHAPDARSLSELQIIRRFQEADLPWLVQQSLAALTEAEQKKWSLLVQELFLTDVNRYWTPVLEASLQNKVLAQDLSFWFGPVVLDSREAAWQREEWTRSQEAVIAEKEEDEDESLALTSPQRQIDLALQETGAGAKNVWWGLAELLGNWQRQELDADIRKYRTWQHLDQDRRSRVVRAAQIHVSEGEDPGDGTMSRSFKIRELSSFRALYLASSETPDFCSRLSQDVVAKWTPILLRKPGLVDDKAEPYAQLLRLASQKAPDVVVQKISQAIDEQNRAADDNDQPNFGTQLRECWNDRVEILLIEKLTGGELKPRFAGYLLEILLTRKSVQAQMWALQVLGESIPTEPADQEVQLRVALSLLFMEGDGWSSVWSRISALAALQDALEELTVNHLYNEFEWGLLTTLAGSRLGEICAWLQDLPKPAQSGTGVHAGPRGIAEVFRGQLFNHLQGAGTPGALQTLEHLALLRPDDPGPKWMLAEAGQASLRQTWIPPTPATILAMARRPDSRIVDSGEQLLAVTIESLERLQQKLHGHTPLVDFLWNRWPDDNGRELWRPKDEEDASNLVKLHFDEDFTARGIVLNREVEIRRSRGKEIRQGQETDILVDAIARNPRSGEPQRISVVIEVKGCWNDDLKSAMKEQLAARYLAESNCRHGLYLVGWFLCDAWDAEDYRKGRTPKWSLQQAKEYFHEQAAELPQSKSLIRAFVLDTAIR